MIIVFRQGEVQEPDSVLLSLKSSKFIASTSVGSFLLERNSYSNTSLVRNDIGQLVKLGHCLEKKISLAGLFPFARKKKSGTYIFKCMFSMNDLIQQHYYDIMSEKKI